MGFVTPQSNPDQERDTGGATGQVDPPELLGATGVVHHEWEETDGSITSHHQEFNNGRLVRWETDKDRAPWALRRPREIEIVDAQGVLLPEFVEQVQLRIGDDLHAIPPAEDVADPRWHDVPKIPDATLRVRFELLHSPVGTMMIDVRYVDGIRVDCFFVNEWVPLHDGDTTFGSPDIHIGMPWGNFMKLRARKMTALEAIEAGGSIDARWTSLLLIHGLMQQPEFTELYKSYVDVPSELLWWGQVNGYVSPDLDPTAT